MRGDGQDGYYKESSRDDLIDQAAAWLVALDCGTADETAFEVWRNADPRHASAFAQAAATWRRTADPRVPGLLETSGQTELAAEHAYYEAGSRGAASSAMSRRTALSAGLAAMLAAGGVTAWLAVPQRAYAETMVGERRQIMLPDGSTATLNTNSRIGWHFGSERSIWLERGEALFDVRAGDSALRLHSDAIGAELTPGRFGLRLEPDTARLMVLAGSAKVQSYTIGSGHVAVARGSGLSIEPLDPQVAADATAWEGGRIVFNGMTLGQAVAEYNRYLPYSIVVAEPAIASTRLGGEFRISQPDDFLRSLEDGFGIQHRWHDGKIQLVSAPSPTGGG
ncbi:FecR family protein [Novosphingobium sp. PhB165]|uniref:FecR family protein n=1 Tax=Novosphingobium sp. PhB165 TaxID=2485105 RepID=UPI00104CC70D|nr:FecR domain-containing protein [Novosphingobium sp. PhB165]TCM16149.1 FecR family protein [Novosphingobium sp. PhB165]